MRGSNCKYQVIACDTDFAISHIDLCLVTSHDECDDLVDTILNSGEKLNIGKAN